MRIEARIFELITGFFFLAAIIYTIFSNDPVGITALYLSGGLALIIGTYFRFVARRLEERPEDDPEAEVSDGAGEMGFFSPGSYWPVMLAAAAAVGAVAAAYWAIWMLVIGVVLVVLAVAGLVFEYHLGPEKH